MVNWQWIEIGVLLVVMGTLFSLLGTMGSIFGFTIAIIIVGYMINSIRNKKVTIV
ncbi:MAG: hypothetical protein A4E25_00771 [Methanobacterium sp. PtaB.Bin024]|jgi:hypothetical protein|nr:MAG: hypothetical protein A4E25_00771 [Methanobacterium sp. PtaB.Bin024]